MHVRYLGKSNPIALIHGKVYECLGIEMGSYRVIDEEGYDENEELQGYLYEMKFFEVVDED